MSNAFSAAWLAGQEPAAPFLPLDFREERDRARAVEQARRPVDPAFLAAWRAQEATRPQREARREALDALAEGAAVVVTGQQAGLFTGPLYTLYKTASAIAVARALEAQTGRRVVPVFWLQVEDHDWPEIDHCTVPTADGPLRIECRDALGPAGERVAVAHRELGDGIVAALAALDEALGTLPHRESVMDLLARCYRADHSPGRALGDLVAQLFGDAGLLVLDPRDPALAAFAAPVHRVAIEQAGPISRALIQRAEAMREAGFEVQVYVRPGAPLSFFHPDGATGPRYRVERASEGWQLIGRDGLVSASEVEAWLREQPARLSTSALLRPLLQDTWLPTAAYVGGPGEISYLAQIPPIYPFFEREMPLVVPRARFRLVDDKASRLLEQLELSAADVALPRHALLAKIGSAGDGQPTATQLRRQWRQALERPLDAFAPVAEALDKGLARATAKTRAHVLGQLDKLVDRYERTLARNDEVALGRLDRLQALLRPLDAPQERVYGWPWFAARYGVEEFTRLVLDACVPFAAVIRDLEPAP